MTDESILAAIDQQIDYHHNRFADYTAAKEVLLGIRPGMLRNVTKVIARKGNPNLDLVPRLAGSTFAQISAQFPNPDLSVSQSVAKSVAAGKKQAKRIKRIISPEGKVRIAAAQKKRWAKVKREKKLATGKEA